MSAANEIIGLVPSGGYGKRMRPIKVWKELIHVGYKKVKIGESMKNIPKVVSEYTVENMIEAGAKKIIMILNDQKFDIFRYFEDGSQYGASIVYTCQNADSGFTGMPIAIDTAYPWIQNKTVLMGMPDTIVDPYDSFKHLLKSHQDQESDLTLGVLPTNCPQRLAPVVFDEVTSEVRDIFDKPKSTQIYNTWCMAVWSGRFTELLHSFVNQVKDGSRPCEKEIILSDVFRESLRQGLKVYARYFPKGSFHDLGDVNEFISSRIKIEKATISEEAMNV
ncbi:MAG: sugar phosphate nucleotidyltransferase [Clostridia bacterium]|nr:sugar phosphate nucleotidyltransferase [Clostridia bacterium]